MFLGTTRPVFVADVDRLDAKARGERREGGVSRGSAREEQAHGVVAFFDSRRREIVGDREDQIEIAGRGNLDGRVVLSQTCL